MPDLWNMSIMSQVTGHSKIDCDENPEGLFGKTKQF